MISRASTNKGTPRSTAATVTVSDFDSVSRPVVISRAMVLADGTLCRAWSSTVSARRRRPFCNDPQRASEASSFKAAPQFGTIVMTGKPLRVEPLQMMFEGAFSNSEHVGSLPPKNPTDQASAMSAQPYDLLDGGARRRQLEDGGIGVLPSEKTFVLEALGSGEQAG